MSQLLKCSQGHSWSAEADSDSTHVLDGPSTCPHCGLPAVSGVDEREVLATLHSSAELPGTPVASHSDATIGLSSAAGVAPLPVSRADHTLASDSTLAVCPSHSAVQLGPRPPNGSPTDATLVEANGEQGNPSPQQLSVVGCQLSGKTFELPTDNRQLTTAGDRPDPTVTMGVDGAQVLDDPASATQWAEPGQPAEDASSVTVGVDRTEFLEDASSVTVGVDAGRPIADASRVTVGADQGQPHADVGHDPLKRDGASRPVQQQDRTACAVPLQQDASSLTVDSIASRVVDEPSSITMDVADARIDEAAHAAAGKTQVVSLSGGPGDMSAAGQSSLAGYEIIKELGRGAMGVVYKARQLALNRLVALKMVLAGQHAGPRVLARFQIEAEAVARLHHPNIVQIYEIGEQAGCPFFSLEFVAGGTLADRIATGPRPAREAAEVVRQLGEAMDCAHRAGVVHRDLKPANILLAIKPDAEGPPGRSGGADQLALTDCIAKVTDFGLAKRLEGDSGQTHAGTIMGTPSYMAPEQAEGKVNEVGPAADIYALGAILYDMLTGRPPFVGKTVLDTLQQVKKVEPTPPRVLLPRVPHDLDTICLKCLEKDPRKRYASAGDLAADLERFLKGEPIRARRVGIWERGWKWCKRRPAGALLTGLGVLAALGLAVGGPLLAQYEHQRASVKQTFARKP